MAQRAADLDGANVVPTMTKPFDVLAEGLDPSKNRGDRTPVELFAIEIGRWDLESEILTSRRNTSA